MIPPQMRILGAVLLTLLPLAYGCGDSTRPQRVPSSIALDPTFAVLSDGTTVQLTASVLDQHGEPFEAPPAGFTVQWMSDDPAIASVDGTGLVSGNRPGVTQVTAAAGTLTTSAQVTVQAVPAVVQAAGGDEQSGPIGAALPEPIAVRVLDRHGQGAPGIAVSFTVTGGGGSVFPAIAGTDTSGYARTTWTLGSTPGANLLGARVGGLSDTLVTFRATGWQPSSVVLTGIAPELLVEGQGAALTGSGFDPVPANNRVTIGGVAASVTAASESSLQILVPPGICQPTGNVEVRVSVGSEQSNPLNHPFRPAEYLSLAVGEQQLLRDPAGFCLHFAQSSAAEAYLIGVQSVTEAPGSLTPVTLRAFAASTAAAPFADAAARPLPAEGRQGTLPRQAAPVSEPAEAAFLRRHRALELQLREWERRHLAPRRAEALVRRGRQPGAITPSALPANLQVGDVVPIRVPDFIAGNGCTDYRSIQAAVRTIGTRGIWLEDLANPTGGFTTDDFQALSQFFDNDAYVPITDYFGAPSDVDDNQRVVIVATKEVNRSGLGGFVFSGDLFPRSTCASSNEGEYYYGYVPDPTGSFGTALTRASAVAGTKVLIPHEVTHVIQFGRRMQVQGQWQSTWELEGQATLAEEITGHHLSGRSPGQNYGRAVAWNNPPSTELWWYRGFTYLAHYFGFETNESKVPNAPEQCTFLGGARHGNNGPCINPDFNYYGASWSFLRWLSDQFGPDFNGGERGLHRALVEHRQSGFATISDVVGRPMDELLAQWAAALYVDDRIAEAQPRLTFTSWNMFDVMDSRVPSARLQPRQRTFSAFSDPVTVRGGSTAYFRVSGSGRPATAISARTATDTPLPGHMRVWVVRLQ